MDIRALRFFLAIAETLSISRAAERCGIAQPSLSQRLRQLEARVGQRLFDRMARGVALTDAGRALLPHARRLLREANALEALVRTDLRDGRGALAIGAIPTMAPFVLPPVLARLARQFPECELTLREDFTANLVEALIDHELDLAILSTPIHAAELQIDVLARERLLLVAARDSAFAAGAAPAIGDLQDQPAVVMHEMHCMSQQIESFCSARRLRRRIVCRSAQLDTVLELVGIGLGISLVPEMCARTDASDQRRYFALGRNGPTREIAVAYRVDRTRSRLSRALVDLLRAELRSGAHRIREL